MLRNGGPPRAVDIYCVTLNQYFITEILARPKKWLTFFESFELFSFPRPQEMGCILTILPSQQETFHSSLLLSSLILRPVPNAAPLMCRT